MSFTRSVPVGAVLPASDLSVVSALLCSHDVFLSPQGNAIGNVITYSYGSEQCISTIAAVSFGWEFAITDLSSASARSFSFDPP